MRLDICNTPCLCPPPSSPSYRPSLHARRPPESSNEQTHTRDALSLPRYLSSLPSPWTNPTSTPDTPARAPVAYSDSNSLTGA